MNDDLNKLYFNIFVNIYYYDQYASNSFLRFLILNNEKKPKFFILQQLFKVNCFLLLTIHIPVLSFQHFDRLAHLIIF